ncbi:hypothetical protein JAAARDRAFT_171058 [Jaapia argillacea MUCL 33604]|uniref:histone acetyltransferase n=1 Tax=Jaapia argillacea MUCL 33604 TaxID=933084 RepID=A0A067Q6A0_9AGAM|nr:hypothetical protein JAAARDRAFT_171058 [Jaapia argillacea MUCL 33604]
MNLRDTLLSSLKTLPGTREFHVHVIVSSPRRDNSLYPYAHPRPRVYLQDILVLLSEQVSPDSPRNFVSAIEAYLYHIPATSCAVLNITKLDSTGQAIAPSPTPTLIQSFITFYGDRTTRPVAANHIWIHVFARAQNQYLFPNSSEYPGKRPLGDIQLCAWWKRVLTRVASEVESRAKNDTLIRLFHILPGYGETEAMHALQRAASSSAATPHSSSNCSWTYGHPYSQSEIPLPCSNSGSDEWRGNLGNFVPSFDDDPKSRFMDEIAYITEADGVRSPQKKRPKLSSNRSGDLESTNSVNRDDDSRNKRDKGDRPRGELDRVTPGEFWERMSFRQECVSGAVTAFFVVGISCPADTPSLSPISPLSPQPGQVSSQINKRIMSTLLTGHEFSTLERSVRATELLEGAIKGLCEGLSAMPAKPISVARPPRSHEAGRRTPEPQCPSDVLPEPPRTPPRRLQVLGSQPTTDITPNPFPEPVASLETYNSYIYGSVSVCNPPLPSRPTGEPSAPMNGRDVGQPVTVLAVRKKKKHTK